MPLLQLYKENEKKIPNGLRSDDYEERVPGSTNKMNHYSAIHIHEPKVHYYQFYGLGGREAEFCLLSALMDGENSINFPFFGFDNIFFLGLWTGKSRNVVQFYQCANVESFQT